jgi:hypothetical protein
MLPIPTKISLHVVPDGMARLGRDISNKIVGDCRKFWGQAAIGIGG